MAARANWKGVLKAGEVSCPVALYTAASTAERIAFHILNRKTGHRVHREFVDAETGERVEAKEQVKGYETGPGDYIAFEPEEIAKAIPEADKTLDVEAFVPCDQVDDVYFDRPYYLAPSAPAAAEAFALIRDVMASANVVAVARTVLFRRVRSVLIRAHGEGLIAHTLNFDYEVRSAEEAFSELPDAKADDEILIVLQCEHITAVKNFDEVYSVPGIDAVFVGPNDLKASMRSADGKPPTEEAFTPETGLASELVTLGRKPKPRDLPS